MKGPVCAKSQGILIMGGRPSPRCILLSFSGPDHAAGLDLGNGEQLLWRAKQGSLLPVVGPKVASP